MLTLQPRMADDTALQVPAVLLATLGTSGLMQAIMSMVL